MAISKKTATGPAPTSFDDMAQAGSFDTQVLRLPGNRGPWTIMVSPGKLTCRDGRILPVPAKAPHDTGFSSNVEGGLGNGMVSDLQRLGGFVVVPHRRPVVAFGSKHEGLSNYLRMHEGTGPNGRGAAVYWTDAWTRPVMYGHILDWEYDHEGRDEWLEGLIDIIAPNGLADAQIRAAIQPAVSAAQALMDREDRRGKRLLAAQVLHIPAEHVPDDLRDVYEAAAGKGMATAKK